MKIYAFFSILAALSFSHLASAANLKPFGKSVINELLSDHEAFSVDMPLGGKDGTTKINFLSWNTWARGSRGGFDDNTPGFSLRVEPNVEKRITDSFALVKKFLNDNKNAIVALQEVGDKDIGKLKQFGDNIESVCAKTVRESFNNCILYKTTEFKIVENASSNNIRSLNNLSTENAPKVSQQNRYIHVKLKNIASDENVDVVSVHLKWHSNPDQIINALNGYFAACKGTCLIAGDFNQNLNNAKAKIDRATLFVYENGSVSSAGPNKPRKVNSTEGMSYRLGSSK